MCAITAGQRGKSVLVIEKANRIGKKILMSGGGRCNFTHLHTTADHFISANPHFCKSALARFTPSHFLQMVEQHDILWHEKTAGQLFCTRSSRDIVSMLADECDDVGVEIICNCSTQTVSQSDKGFMLETTTGSYETHRLVVATGGLSIPKMGASDYGHQLAGQFGLAVLPLRAGLVPFTLPAHELEHWAKLSGVSADVNAQCNQTSFRENMLFTHRGLSGPAMLQLSSYWQPGQNIHTDLMPDEDADAWLKACRDDHARMTLKNMLAQRLGRRLAEIFCSHCLPAGLTSHLLMADLSNQQIDALAQQIHGLSWSPDGTEGYRTALLRTH